MPAHFKNIQYRTLVTIHPFKVNVIVRGVGCDPFKVIPVISYLIDYGSRTITVSTEDVKL